VYKLLEQVSEVGFTQHTSVLLLCLQNLRKQSAMCFCVLYASTLQQMRLFFSCQANCTENLPNLLQLHTVQKLLHAVKTDKDFNIILLVAVAKSRR
jgi:hypothetical protein